MVFLQFICFMCIYIYIEWVLNVENKVFAAVEYCTDIQTVIVRRYCLLYGRVMYFSSVNSTSANVLFQCFVFTKCHRFSTLELLVYRSADKSLAQPTSWCILFDGKNISFDASLVIYINSTNIQSTFLLFQTDAHDYKIIGILKQLKFRLSLRHVQFLPPPCTAHLHSMALLLQLVCRHDIDHVSNDEHIESYL